ncbi:hypothetical protein [Nocardioides sp. YIM 152588]|uniref:hypothetical protein n=1 Tax=Nocardioides sp. YIM 152588 TaxID=3158259 RepID=UPI0032E4D997
MARAAAIALLVGLVAVHPAVAGAGPGRPGHGAASRAVPGAGPADHPGFGCGPRRFAWPRLCAGDRGWCRGWLGGTGRAVIARDDSMYVWEDPAQIESGNISEDYEPVTLVGFAAARGVDTIMVAVPWALPDGAWVNTRAWLREVVLLAHALDIEVLALGGENSWAAEPALAVQWMGDATSAGIPFDGVNFDVEPWSLPEWETDRETVKAQLIGMLDEVAATPARPVVHVDVPYWLADESFPGESSMAAAMFARADGGTVITFVDRAFGEGGIVRLSLPALDAAAEHGLRVPIAVEVSEDIGPEWSFSDDGTRALRRETFKTRAAFACHPAFAGIAVEKYVAWRHLGP